MMEVIGVLLLTILLTIIGISLGVLLIWGLMTYVVYLEENK
jgi:hypothetical protein